VCAVVGMFLNRISVPFGLCKGGERDILLLGLAVGILAGLPPAILKIFAYFLSVTVLGFAVGGNFLSST